MQDRGCPALALNVHGALDLDRKAKTELAANMKLPVAPLIVCQRRSQLDPALAAHHHQLRELLLDDEALLDQRDMQLPGQLGGLLERSLRPLAKESEDLQHAAAGRMAELTDDLDRFGLLQRNLS